MPPEEGPRSRGRKQLLLKLGVFLLLGAIVNVAVAWGLAITWKSQSSIGLTDRSSYRQTASHVEFAVGLPVRSLEGRRVVTLKRRDEKPDGLWIIRSSSPSRHVYLPNNPIWPGFAINTIFYAAMLSLLWIAPGKSRRFIRVKRHRCPACGYQIDSAPGIGPRCSECGAALPWMKRTE